MNWLAVGPLLCAVAVVAGAFGAHALSSRLSGENLDLWETAARYLMYGGLGLSILGLADRVLDQSVGSAAWALFVGTLIFSGTVFCLAFGAPRWFGALTPIGGLLMIVGFVMFGVSASRAL